MSFPKPTDSELAILQELWQRGPSTVKVIHEALSSSRDIGYTTALKLMQIMHEKGLLTREREGKTHIYQPAVSQEKIQKQLLNKLVDTAFQGSAMKLIMQALGNEKTSIDELTQIKSFIEKLEGGQNE
ncbi:MAG: BlaI/MecI/CopY family transcriptional regulator [Cytophagales bacterium]|nr:BlaI/MecI/CopY family transcriptional regulator [Cytophagales bacterium]